MECLITLHCIEPAEKIVIKTRLPQDVKITEFPISGEARVIENAFYSVTVDINQDSERIANIQLFLNGSPIGFAQGENFEITDSKTRAFILFKSDNNYTLPTAQPFLLQYDLVQLSLCVQLIDGYNIDFISEYYLCLSRNFEDAENINSIIRDLLEYDDDKINRWLFSSHEKVQAANGMIEGGWLDKSYKSINSFLQLIGEVYICYKNNLNYFRHLARHTIEKRSVLESYVKVRSVSFDDYNWLMQNSEQLVVTSQRTAISYSGKYYIPYRMKTDECHKNLDVYENQITIGFLRLVCSHAKYIQAELNKGIENEKNLLVRLQGMERDGFRAPILTVKRYHIKSHQGFLQRLQAINKQLQLLYNEYKQVLPCQQVNLLHFPRKTKIFQEIKPYAEIFKQIIHWFRYGEFDLHKEKILLRIKTLDKLFEYYCLRRLLQMIRGAGFDIDELEQSVYSYPYHVDDPRYTNEYDVANTFVLSNGSKQITLYYQPVIYSSRIENGITLFRTTDRDNYFIPDFLIKLCEDSNSDVYRYIIFDSKYASRKSIRENYLKETILNYSSQIADISGNANVLLMVWLLQGRIDNVSRTYFYHNSPLAKQYSPLPSYGIVSINTKNLNLDRLWDEILLLNSKSNF